MAAGEALSKAIASRDSALKLIQSEAQFSSDIITHLEDGAWCMTSRPIDSILRDLVEPLSRPDCYDNVRLMKLFREADHFYSGKFPFKSISKEFKRENNFCSRLYSDNLFK